MSRQSRVYLVKENLAPAPWFPVLNVLAKTIKQTLVNHVWSSRQLALGGEMDHRMEVLVVSCRPQNRKSLMRIFKGLPLETYCASNVDQAKEFLSERALPVIFCEELLPDGTFSPWGCVYRLKVRPGKP
jgi:hypothetical protein